MNLDLRKVHYRQYVIHITVRKNIVGEPTLGSPRYEHLPENEIQMM